MRCISGVLDYLQGSLTYLNEQYPRLFTLVHWVNVPVTVGNITINPDATLKVLAFLFVTVPLGIIQWWSLYDKLKERRAKKHGSRD